MARWGARAGERRGVGFWAIMLLALVVGIAGIPIFAGGIWLAILGGSWYYVLAGAGLLITSYFLFRRSLSAVWVYLVTFVGTCIWAFWEAGMDGWAQVPRLVGPTVVLVLVLLTIPGLRGQRTHYRAVAASLLGLFAIGALGSMVWSGHLPGAIAQQAPAPAPTEPTEPTEPAEPAPPAGVETPATPDTPATPLPPETVPETAPGDVPNSDADSPTTPAAEAETAMQVATTPTGIPVRGPLANIAAGADWPAYGGTYHGDRYSPLAQITPDNVGQLERVWEYRTGDMPNEQSEGQYSPETTPLKIGDDLYLCSAMGIAIAVDAATGREEWRYDPGVSTDAIPYGATCRGVAYFEVPDAGPDDLCATRILWGTLDARLIAVDAKTGQLCTAFGRNGEVFLEEGIGDTVPGWYSVTSAPTIVRGIAVLGAQVKDGQAEDSPSGVVRGYDAVTGQLAWAWDLGNPSNRGAPAEGEVYTRGTPNMWTTAAADEELGYVYLPLGNSAVDYYGSNRSDLENEYATALVAVDVTTGDDVWHFQTVHHDVWDYDLGSQPSLVNFPGPDGTPVPALLVSSKQGDIYVLDRRTGEPLTPVEERPAPQGLGVEPDYLAATQPHSGYHSLVFPELTEKDMWGMTPIDQLWCRIQFHLAHYQGPYTPPTSDKPWIQYPGYNGGQDWGSMAVDTERGILIANYNDMPNYNQLIPREEAGHVKAIFEPDYQPGGAEEGPQLGSPYAIRVNAGWQQATGLMCKKPPYGGIRAIDLNTGETLWDRPFGEARANGPFGLPSMLPIDIGTPNNGGPIVTAGGLIFVAATTDNLIHAIDIETGRTVWTDTLPAGGQTTPITYEVGGRQFVAIAPGGHHFMKTPIGDYLIAWSLPQSD